MSSIFKKLRIIWLPVLFIVLSIIIGRIADGNIIDDFVQPTSTTQVSEDEKAILQQKINIIKEIFRWFEYVVFIIPILIDSYVHHFESIKSKKYKMRLGENYRYSCRAIMVEDECISRNTTSRDFNIRIFKKKGKFLISDDIDGFYGQSTNRRLSFSFDKKQGLCTQAYVSKQSICEPYNVLDDKYNLTEDQKAASRNSKFMIAVPIVIKEKSTKYVICVSSSASIINEGKLSIAMRDIQNIAYEIYNILFEVD